MTDTELLELNHVSQSQVLFADWLAIGANQCANSAFGIFVISTLVKFSKILVYLAKKNFPKPAHRCMRDFFS